MMEIKMFAERVAATIKDYLPTAYSDVECRIMEKQKNNGVLWTGIYFQMPGEKVSPLVYMESYYHIMKSGTPFDEVIQEIAFTADQVMRDAKNMPEISVDHFEDVKDHLRVSLINTKANRRMLSEIPHMEIEDLSAVCSIALLELGEIKVTNEHLAQWGIEKNQLFSEAFNNIKESDYVMEDMAEVINGLMSEKTQKAENLFEWSERGSADPKGFYVLSNKNHQKGASVMLCPGAMEKVCKMIPQGFYILPSSIHEVLVIPKGGMHPKGLGHMVREINAAEVEPEEVLSDRIYEYDRERGKICQVPDSMEKNREMER